MSKLSQEPDEDLKVDTYDPNTMIAIFWSIEDVKSLRPALTDEQCMEVLQMCKAKHDACIGINWEVIEVWIDHLFGEEA